MMSAEDARAQFRRALEQRDIIPPKELEADGKMHRCDAAGRNGKGDASYVLHLDGIPAGGFENFRDGIGWENWHCDSGRLLSESEKEEQRRRAEADRQLRQADEAQRRAEAATRAAGYWQEATDQINGHPYLARKGVGAHGIRLRKDRLVLPVRDIDGALCSLQFIGPEGDKRFLRGGRKKSCFYAIGDFGPVILIGEGYATCATVHEATGHPCAVAFDSGNLIEVAKAIRAKYPHTYIVILADDDYRTKGNPGLAKARQAAAAVAAMLAIPDFGSDRPDGATDFNDMALHLGLEAVESCITKAIAAGAIEPPTTSSKSLAAEAKQPSQRDKLLMVTDRCQFWKCDEGIAHVTMPVQGHQEHHRVRSGRFREWLLLEARREFPQEIAGKVRPGTFGKNALEDAMTSCESIAAAAAVGWLARQRIAQHGDALYLDLGTPDWRAIQIRGGRWSIVDSPPVPILRTRRTKALPIPDKSGSLDSFYEILPLDGEDDRRLVLLWLLSAMRPTGPYPILALSGEQGTGKSFLARVLRRLVDPCGDDIMQPPREDRDLIAAARGNHVLAFDNLSTISTELADSLCRIASGGDIGGRALYTDNESAAFAAQRPVILNGIPDLVSRGDLASRSIFIRLAPMRRRRAEAELWATFQQNAPGILGALLDVLAAALADLPRVTLPEDSAPFRMADFTMLAMAAEPALGWPAGAAIEVIRRNVRAAGELIADLDLVAIALREFLEQQGEFTGMMATLYKRLSESVDTETRKSQGWPRGANRFSERLRRIAPALRATGIDFIERSRIGAGRPVEIRKKTPV